jgi:hypothetical protein
MDTWFLSADDHKKFLVHGEGTGQWDKRLRSGSGSGREDFDVASLALGLIVLPGDLQRSHVAAITA